MACLDSRRNGFDHLAEILDVFYKQAVYIDPSPFTSQTLRGADSTSIEALLHKLEAKLTIGRLLDMKVEAQGLSLVESAEDADEAYIYEWALNPADVAKLLYP